MAAIIKSMNDLKHNLSSAKINSYQPNVLENDLEECLKEVEKLTAFQDEIEKILLHSKIALNADEDEDDEDENINQELKQSLLEAERLFDEVSNLASQREQKLDHLLKLSKDIDVKMSDIREKLKDPKPNEIEEIESKIQVLEKNIAEFDENVKPQTFEQLLESLNSIKSEFKILQEKLTKEPIFLPKVGKLGKLELIQKLAEDRKPEDKSKNFNYFVSSSSNQSKSTQSFRKISEPILKTSLNSFSAMSSKHANVFNFFTIDKLKSLNDNIKLVEESLLTSSVLNDKDFFEFEKQKPALTDAQQKMDLIKPSIDKMMIDKERCAIFHDKGSEMVKLIELVFENWLNLREMFMKRYRRWWWADSIRDNLEYSYNQLTGWMDSVEKLFNSSRLPSGELDVERAKEQNDSLLFQFNNHSIVYGEVKVLSHKVISQSITKDAFLLQNKFDTVDQRWEAIARELAWRRERIENESNSRNIELDFKELIKWIGKCTLILNRMKGNLETLELTNVTLNEMKVNSSLELYCNFSLNCI